MPRRIASWVASGVTQTGIEASPPTMTLATANQATIATAGSPR
jgi:hypothetical protein